MGINREKVRTPKRGRGWCRKCDASEVSDGQKCTNCGKKHGVTREKYKKNGLTQFFNSYPYEHVYGGGL